MSAILICTATGCGSPCSDLDMPEPEEIRAREIKVREQKRFFKMSDHLDVLSLGRTRYSFKRVVAVLDSPNPKFVGFALECIGDHRLVMEGNTRPRYVCVAPPKNRGRS